MTRRVSVRLDSVARIFDGPHATPEKTSTGPLFLGISSLANGRLDLSQAERLSESDYAHWTRRIEPEAGDVVFSYETRLGEAALIPEGLRCCLGRRMGLLRVNREIADPRYVLYAYLGPEFQAVLRARTVHGSTVDRIPLQDMGSFPFPLLPVAVQVAVGALLGAIDDKIELNRQMNETLEAMARALFKSWFFDFDPVRAKMAGRAPFGMDAATAALFPSGLANDVPLGWSAVRLSDIIDLSYGKPLRAEERRPGEVRVFGSGGQVGWHDEALVRGPGVVVGRKGNAGAVSWSHTDFYPIDTAYYVVPRQRELPLVFLYHLLMEQDLASVGADSAVPGLNRTVALMNSAVLPTAGTASAFAAVAMPIRDRIAHNSEESRTLAELRDLLLPKLLSGELRIRNAERLVEAAL